MPQPTNVTFANAEAFAAHHPAITALLQQTLEDASVVLPVDTVHFTVTADAARAIPGWGMGGYALGPNDVEIVIDPDFPGLGSILPERLPAIAAHELHHTVRWRNPGPYATLLEALVFEGMADHFAIELLGAPIPPWSDAFPESDTQRYLNRARPEFDQGFDFNAWFFGIGTDLPQWSGYTLGFRLIRDYLDAHPDTSAAELVNTPALVFRPL